MNILTIIIPHYNSTVSLTRLLKTIPNSRDIQTIVIDDKSDDRFKKELIAINRDYNIDLFLNESNNKGAGACRNIGLENATGKWILFADADDYFIDGFHEIIKEHIQSTADVIFFEPTSIEIDTGAISSRHLPYVKLIDDVLYGGQPMEAALSLRYKFIVPWSKLYRTAFLRSNHILFDEVISANDVMFSTKAGYHLNEFEVSKEVIYCVTMNKGSLTMTVNSEVFNTRLNVFINQYRFLRERLPIREFKRLGLSGRPILIKSAELGVSKLLAVFLKLNRHNIRVLEPKLFNPVWFINKVLFVFMKHRREQKYLNKG